MNFLILKFIENCIQFPSNIQLKIVVKKETNLQNYFICLHILQFKGRWMTSFQLLEKRMFLCAFCNPHNESPYCGLFFLQFCVQSSICFFSMVICPIFLVQRYFVNISHWSQRQNFKLQSILINLKNTNKWPLCENFHFLFG